MNNQPLLDRLCEHYHIAAEYYDIWGKRHLVSQEIRRSLLTAMCVSTESDEAMQQALSQAETTEWCRTLPPVQVVWEGEEFIRIQLGVSANNIQHRHRCILQEENGPRQETDFKPAELELQEQKTFSAENWQRRVLLLNKIPACGYHQLEVYDINTPQSPPAGMLLIVAPRTCYQPQAIQNSGRVWGPALQLYAVRSARNWGIGDFTDLIRIVEVSAHAGAGIVGVNPLHALFPHKPEHASPYSPSSRLFLNILYLDVEAIADFLENTDAQQQVADEVFQARLRALRAEELVDYAGVSREKQQILQTLYQHFRQQHLQYQTERCKEFRRFQDEQGQNLHRHALYETLQAELYAQDPDIWGWPVWPEAYRFPLSEAVVTFDKEHHQQVEYFEYLQWQAHLQLQAVGQRAYQLGLGIGLYQDLAVSVASGGAEAWANQDLYALQASIGSPPDDYNLKGQNWGLPPWCPERLREQAYRPFIATLQQNMRAAGALRIDHVMSLLRLFWIPTGQSAKQGCYVFYPMLDLLGILALESHRNRCLVIGEDLGTVPGEVREALHPLGVLSYRLLYFEKGEDGNFKPSQDFEPQALVAASTHDLPPLAGYWQGKDLEMRDQLGLFPNANLREQQIIGRAEDRARLLVTLEREELLPVGISVQPVATSEMTLELTAAIHRYLARTPCQVMVVQLEDILGQVEQTNLPGTTEEHPNWCRKLTLDLELWGENPRVMGIVNAMRKERGSAVKPPVSIPARPTLQAANIPSSTYRLQLHHEFAFNQAAEIVPYLHELGISHCYASPCLQARPGSKHGYDIINHHILNVELGGAEAFGKFNDQLHAHHLGLIMDIVPNHMGVMGSDNSWWLDILENGAASIYAGFFDINWSPRKVELRGKVLLPVLGDYYGNLLETSELQLRFDSNKGGFSLRYYAHEFPVDPREYPRILTHDIARLEKRLGATAPRVMEFQSLITAFSNLPARSKTAEAHIRQRARDKEVHKVSLARLYQDADIAHYLQENLQTFNSKNGVELLHELLENQAWRLAYWRVASDEINYRRFFDINDLAGLRMENPQVFEATHELILQLIAEDKVQGLRIDHPDGLYDPAAYFRQLQAEVIALQSRRLLEHDGQVNEMNQADEDSSAIYIVVEKILAGHERLRQDWQVHGTTGYEFTNLLNGLFVDTSSESVMEKIYRNFTGTDTKVDEMVYVCKKLIMRSAMASELQVLAEQLSEIAELDHHTRDFTFNSLREALSEIVACFPVYRTYIGYDGASKEDRRYIHWAVKVAKKRSPAVDTLVFDFIQEVLLTDIKEGKSEKYQQQVSAFAMKFQQYSGPVMAKGLEDTTFYRYHRLVSLNEVGGEPQRFGVSLAAFHHQNLERSKYWPHSMLGSSTHDSKRSEDVRARINVLSELPEEWQTQVQRWAKLNQTKKQLLEEEYAPTANDEYFLYQTLLGTWPLQEIDNATLAGYRERIHAYMLKAVKEAKEYSSWINPYEEYENAVADFVNALLSDVNNNPFLTDFIAFHKIVSRPGLFNSLAQTLLKLTCPGMPDIYQGNELWDFSLVDPDNRRPVDYQLRRDMLNKLISAGNNNPPITLLQDMLSSLEDGRAKLYLTWQALQLRQAKPGLFRDGEYLPLTVSGQQAEHVCAFIRRLDTQQVITVVPRLIYSLAKGADPLGEEIWGDTWIEVPAASWHNCLSAENLKAEPWGESWRLAAGHILRHFPVALLISQESVA